MEFRILGRLEVLADGEQLPLGGARQRALLALLLLHRRETLSLDRIVDQLWGERPPPTAPKTVQVYVSRLRKVLGDGVIETRGHGYRLVAEARQTDLDRYEELAAEARAALESGDAAAAARSAASALATWRGDPLEEFADEPFARLAIARLHEARLATVEDRVEAELQLGRGSRLVVELQRLVAEHPLRERLVAALMLALYHAGRQADALAVGRQARRRLDEELGLQPGPEIRELERRILIHDPSLGSHRRPVAAAPRPGRRTRRYVLAALAIALAAGLGLLFTAPAQPERQTLDGASGVLALDAGSQRVLAARQLAADVAAMSLGANSVWVTDPGAGAVLRLDRRSGTIVDRIRISGEPAAMAVGGRAVWVASTVGGTISRIDPVTGTVTQTIQLPGSNVSALVFGFGHLWAADSVTRSLFEIDPSSGVVRRDVSLGVEPSAAIVADGALWVAGYDSSSVLEVGARLGRVLRRISVGDGPAALAAGAGAIWVANSLDATVSRLNPGSSQTVATIPVSSGPAALAVRGGSVWVAEQDARELSRIDPSSNRVTGKVALGGAPGSLIADGRRIWAGVAAASAAHRGGTLTLVTTQRFGSLDPALYDVAPPPQFIGLSYDTLVTFDHGGGADGLRLVPDLALSVPRPTDGGRTYLFRLRPRILYSDGRPVRAADFRRAIERSFRLGSPGSASFGGLVGAGACVARPRRCDLSRGVVTDDQSRTVAFRFRVADPDFLLKLAASGFTAPIPAGTSDHGRLPPGTGPYRVAAAGATAIRLVRNRYFREWSRAAQPQGNPDAIVWRFVSSAAAAVAAVRSGHADWFFGLIPRGEYGRLALEAPEQLHDSPLFAVDFFPLNTHRAPFDDVRVRRALNDAIDRARLVRMYGGPAFATATCQPLAPGLPGYRRYCPYGVHVSEKTGRSGPDLRRARELVRDSGTRGERIELWGSSDESYIPRGVPGYVAGVLRSLGYRVRLRIAPQASISEAHRRRLQLSVDGDWLADYPDPSSYLPDFFGCHGGTSNGYYCSPSLDHLMARASALRAADPARSAALWTVIDHRLTDAAPWVATVNEREVDLVSRRLRNYEFNPVWGFLPDQSWIGQ